MPQKAKLSKKGRIPQAASREAIEKNNNKMNDKNKSKDDQERLNYIANNIGQTPAPNGLLTLDGVLFLSNIFYNIRFVDLPEQQPVIKKNAPAFEATTRIDVRREGNHTRIYSYVSTSTINRERIQSLNMNQTMSHPSTSIAPPFVSASSFFGNQTFDNQTSTSTQSAIDIAKRAHELSVFFHQKVHGLYQLVNCTTMRRTDQVNTWIVTGKSVEQTRFTTICQDAVGQAERRNNQGMKQESENATFSSHHITNTTDYGFHPPSAEETAQKLSKVFQDSFENKHNTTIKPLNHVHNQLSETFWNELTKLFYQFFSQHEHTVSTQDQKETSGSLLSHFVDLLLQAFSVNHREQIPTHPQSEKNLNYQIKTSFSDQSNQTKKRLSEVTPEMVSKTALEMAPETLLKTVPVLNSEEEGVLSQLWQLATDFYEVVDHFLQQSIGLQFLGVEAIPLPTTRIPSLELEENYLTLNETQIIETTTGNSLVNETTSYVNGTELEVMQTEESDATEEINKKIKAFLHENKDDPSKVVIQEEQELPLPEWTSEQKENIHKKLVDFFIENGIACQESNVKELVETVGEWVLLEGASPATLDMVKVKQLAKIILEMGEESVISEEQAGLTVGSWVYETMKDNQPAALALVAETTEQPEEVSTPHSTSTGNKENNVETDGIKWRDPNVRKQVEAFFQQKKLLSDQPTKEELLIAMGKRITQEENDTIVFNHKRIQPLAKVILKALKFKDGKNKEKISNKDAELTIMKWAFETILGSSIEAYMVKTLVSAPDVDQFTMGRLRDLFTVKNLEKEGLIQLDGSTLSQKQKRFFDKLWNFFLQKELPNYFLDSSGLADNLLISDHASLMQLTGAKILKEGGYPQSFSPEDSRLMGQHFWETIIEKRITSYEEFRHLLMPSLLAVAQLEPDLLREALSKGTYKEVAISTFIGYQEAGYYKLIENQELLNRLYKAYQEALLQWRRKDALAATVAEKCREKGSRAPFYIMKQNYLLGLEEPCRDIDWFPPKLEDEYTKLTKNVSEAHLPLDKKLIEYALDAVDQKERAFIFSEGSHLYEAKAELKNESDYIDVMPVISSALGIYQLFSIRKKQITTFNLNKTDLFVAVNGEEERWYALKRLDEEGGYILYRVDQDPLSYLKYGLFNRKDLWEKGYQQVGNEIHIGNKYFKFSAHVNRSKKLSYGIEKDPFIEILSRKHSDQLYSQLYDSGNDKADIEKAWNVIKHFIPFYDCVTGIINQDVGEAVTSCTIDALLFIPVFGQIASLNMKFALGVARAFVRGGIRSVIKNSRHFLPNVAEIRKLVLGFARTLDPGFETVIGGGRLVVQKLVKFKNELRVGKKMKEMLERVESMEKAQEAWKKSIEIVEWNGLEVPVRKVNNQLYMRVTNLKTAEVFGGLFMKKGNRIEPYRPAKFTTEQLNLINLLEVRLDKKQVFVVEINPNPQAYGTGEITTVAKEGEETKRFIRMKGKLIEVTMTAIKEHGVRLDVYDRHAGKILPVNFNGVEWYFEAPTTPFVAIEVEKKIASMLDQFETQNNPSGLSAPDRKGLMWDESSRSYIKINEHYIPLILLDKKLNRYHLVKKDYNEVMTVLRFDEKKGQFRLETELERSQVIEAFLSDQSTVRQRKEKSPSNKNKSSDSRMESEPSTSQEIVSQQGFPPQNVLPASTRHSDEWTKLRKAVPFKSGFEAPRVEDDSVMLGEFSAFLPEKTAVYYNDKKWLKKKLKSVIYKNLSAKHRRDFRVYVGLKADTAPEYIKLLREKLVGEFKKAQEKCAKTKKTCNSLLKKRTLVETPQGQYLIQLFQLEKSTNQEEILREIIKKLRAVAEKGELFLQKTADLGFENIWIVSTDLVRKKGTNEYRSLCRKNLSKAEILEYDPECRILIYADAFHLDPDVKLGKETRIVGSDLILHEVTHHTEVAEDVVRYSPVEKNFTVSAEDVLKDYVDIYPTLLKSEAFKVFVNHLAKSLNKPTISMSTVAKEMETNFMLRANFQMTDAEMLMVLLRDLADGRAFNQRPRVKRSISEEGLEIESMFQYLAMKFVLGDGISKTIFQFNKAQEQTTTRTTDVVENTSVTSNRSFLNLVTSSIERSNSSTQIAVEQQISTELSETTVKKNFLDYVGTSTERSIKAKSMMSFNHPISQNKKELSLQH